MILTGEGTSVKLRTPGQTMAEGMSEYEEECLHELFTMPGGELLKTRMLNFQSEFATNVMNANRQGEAGDKYEVGRYDGVQDFRTFIENLVEDADPGR